MALPFWELENIFHMIPLLGHTCFVLAKQLKKKKKSHLLIPEAFVSATKMLKVINSKNQLDW